MLAAPQVNWPELSYVRFAGCHNDSINIEKTGLKCDLNIMHASECTLPSPRKNFSLATNDNSVTIVQWVKKPSQCFDVLERLTCLKMNKLDNNLKIIYVIE